MQSRNVLGQKDDLFSTQRSAYIEHQMDRSNPFSLGNHSSTRKQVADPGNSLKTAFKIPVFFGRREFKNGVSINDRDFYCFKLPERRSVNVKATNLAGEIIAVAVLGRQGRRVLTEDSSVNPGKISSLAELNLRAGTYYIRLESAAKVTNEYRLKLSIRKPRKQPDPFGDGSPGGGILGDYDCADFSSQSAAQSYLLPGDPYGLDGDGDGIACESLPFV